MIDIVSHRVADIVINDEGRINGSPVNVRISHWVLHDSAMAKEAGNIARPAGIIISVSVAEHLERLFRIRYRPITRGSVTRERSSHRLLR